MADEDEDPVEDFERLSDLLPENAMPVFGFRILSFLKDDGEADMTWEAHGERVTGGRALGDVMGAAFEMYHCHLHKEGQDLR